MPEHPHDPKRQSSRARVWAERLSRSGHGRFRPLELVRERGATVLVLEYHDGEAARRLIGEGLWKSAAFLRLAIACDCMRWHAAQRGLVHKDIKAANILIDPRRPESG